MDFFVFYLLWLCIVFIYMYIWRPCTPFKSKTLLWIHINLLRSFNWFWLVKYFILYTYCCLYFCLIMLSGKYLKLSFFLHRAKLSFEYQAHFLIECIKRIRFFFYRNRKTYMYLLIIIPVGVFASAAAVFISVFLIVKYIRRARMY